MALVPGPGRWHDGTVSDERPRRRGSTHGLDAVAATATMVPLLPCGDVGAMADFWVALGLEVTYRQERPNPYVALRRGGIELHYYGMPGWDPGQSHSTCVVAVSDTAPVHEAFAAGLRALHGRLPVAGAPRVTRPRRRANNQGLSGFSLVDPAGNWVRVTRRAAQDPEPGPGGSTAWDAAAGGPVARATDNAVVLADSHGDVAQARRILAGALRRSVDAPVAERAPALAYLVELCVREGDRAAAAGFAEQVRALEQGADGLTPQDRAAVAAAAREVADLERRDG